MFLVILIPLLLIATPTSTFAATTIEIMDKISKQLMNQQLYMEERTRSEGSSGIKKVRMYTDGTKPYHSATFVGESVAGIHDHPEYERTIGMGEVVAVLNGVEFRTRHNDYSLVMPSRTSKEFHATEEIPFPDVPPTVKGSVADQIKEMKEWFKAFRNQDHSVRDYRKYFRPVLCYMEGSWTTDTDSLQEPFKSERHVIDASSWEDLLEKIRFTSHSGGKHNLENLAYLPVTIFNVANGEPITAQWNYCILCHPLKYDLPLNRFRVVDDLAGRMMHNKDLVAHTESTAARFQLNPFDTDEWKDGKERNGLLDRLMEEIPGSDNYVGNLTDDAFDILVYKAKSGIFGGDELLNTAFFHRWYKKNKKGAMGLQIGHRSFSDTNVFMAMTSNPKVPEVCYQQCTGRKKRRTCKKYCQRWTYAIPLEIVYLTPLSKWNPYEIIHRGKHDSASGKRVNANYRNGASSPTGAYDGINDHLFYMTPADFFNKSDSSNEIVTVLNKHNEMVKVGGSGLRIKIDSTRLRYPITPIHDEGSVFYKELEALKVIALSPKSYGYMFHEPVNFELKNSA